MIAPRFAHVAAVLIMWTASASAAAGSHADRYKAAVKLENAGNVADALAAFEAIPVAERDFNTRLHIASCKRKLGRMLDSARDYEAIRDDPKADEATRDTAASDLDVVRAATPRLRVTLAMDSKDVEVAIDGAVAKLPIEQLVDPGAHAVSGKRDGRLVFERKVTLAEGSVVDVVVSAPAVTVGPTKPAASPAPRGPAPVGDSGSSARTIGWVVGGGGVASLGVATWSVLRIGSLERERDALAAAGDAAASDRAAEARGAQTVGRIALGVGVVAVGVGAVLILTSKSPDRTVGIGVTPVVGGASLSLRGAW